MEHRYKAFISYAHADEKWARWLQKSLESYRPPKRLGINDLLTPIFRDREDLAAARDLTDSIRTALGASENLIVICSPAAAQSPWVAREIEEFARLGRGNRIFCLFVDHDVPDAECLPEPLKSDDEHEPLAADVRSDADGREGAKLKLAAALFGVSLDELRQRELHRRHRRLAAATGASLVGMTLAVLLAGYAFVAEQEANRQRNIAVEEARKATVINEFLNRMLSSMNPFKEGRSDLTVKEILDTTASRVDEELTGQSEVRASIWATLGQTYLSISELVPAEHYIRLAHNWRLENLGAEHHKRLESLTDLANVLEEQGDFVRSREASRELLELHAALVGEESADYIATLDQLGVLDAKEGRLAEAERVFRRVLQIRTRVLVPGDPSIAQSQTNLAISLAQQSRLADAEQLFREALATRRKSHGDAHPLVGRALNNLAVCIKQQGRFEEALQVHLEALDVKTRALGEDHPDVAIALENTGATYMILNDPMRAEEMFRRALRINRNSLGPGNPQSGVASYELAGVLTKLGRFDDALIYAEDAVSILEAVYPEGHKKIADARGELGKIFVRLGRPDEGRILLIQSLDVLLQTSSPIGGGLDELIDALEEIGEQGLARSYRERFAGKKGATT